MFQPGDIVSWDDPNESDKEWTVSRVGYEDNRLCIWLTTHGEKSFEADYFVLRSPAPKLPDWW